MASTYSDRYKLELQATGANSGTWGQNTNNNLNVVDAFTNGYLSKSVAGSADVTLTTANADPAAEASNKVIELTGALTGDIKVFIPAVESNYIFFNNTTGSHTLSVCATGHAANAIEIVQGSHTIAYNRNDNKMVDLFANSLGDLSIKTSLTVDSTVLTAANGTINATAYSGNGSALTGVSSIPSGSQALFFQAAAPTGWTQNTASAINTTTLQIVTGTGGGVSGTDAFATTFTGSKSSASGPITFNNLDSASASSGTLAVGDTTLSTPEIPSHNHPTSTVGSTSANRDDNRQRSTGRTLNATGSGGSHSHPISGSLSLSGSCSTTTALAVPGMDLKFANVVACQKD
tara:strand:- start:1157 stop:2197 length:1041 start_codon:yes stop_codon:yes gene_type:complete